MIRTVVIQTADRDIGKDQVSMLVTFQKCPVAVSEQSYKSPLKISQQVWSSYKKIPKMEFSVTKFFFWKKLEYEPVQGVTIT